MSLDSEEMKEILEELKSGKEKHFILPRTKQLSVNDKLFSSYTPRAEREEKAKRKQDFKLICEALCDNMTVQNLEFRDEADSQDSGIYFDPDVISQFLKAIKTRHFFGGLTFLFKVEDKTLADEVCDFIKRNDVVLEKLTFGKDSLKNLESVARIISDLHQQRSLRELNLDQAFGYNKYSAVSPENQQIAATVARYVGEILSRESSVYPPIETLSLKFANLNANDIKVLLKDILSAPVVRASLLKSLNLSGNNIGAEGADYVARLLKKNTILTSLSVRSCELGKGIRNIVDGLEGNTHLQYLALSHNRIDEDSAKAIAEMIKKNKVLTELDLDASEMSPESLNIILEAAKQNTTLKTLNLMAITLDAKAEQTVKELQKLHPTLKIVTDASRELLMESVSGSLDDWFQELKTTSEAKTKAEQGVENKMGKEKASAPVLISSPLERRDADAVGKPTGPLPTSEKPSSQPSGGNKKTP